jgi:hypothetical protein
MEKQFYEHVVSKGGDEIFGDHVRHEMISCDYVERRRGDSLTTRFGEEVMEKQSFCGSLKETALYKASRTRTTIHSP